MSSVRKARTVLQLAASFDFKTLRRQFDRNVGELRIHWHGGRPFVYSDMGFPFVCHPDWPDSAAHFCAERRRSTDAWELPLLKQWLEPGDTVLDAGANLGLYTFASASAVGSSGRVVAVEAAPYIVEKLHASARLLGAYQVQTIQAAVTRECGTIRFYIRPDHFATGEQSLRPPTSQLTSSIPVEVPGRTLRDLDRELSLTPRLGLVKVDIEGAESEALETAPAAWLAANGPLWIVEINPSALARFEAKPRDITTHFAPESFDCWLLAKHALSDPASPEPPLRPLTSCERFHDSLYYNLIAVPKGAQWRSRVERLQSLFLSTNQ